MAQARMSNEEKEEIQKAEGFGGMLLHVSRIVSQHLSQQEVDENCCLLVLLGLIVAKDEAEMERENREIFRKAVENLDAVPMFLLRTCIRFGKPQLLEQLIQVPLEDQGAEADGSQDQIASGAGSSQEVPGRLLAAFSPSDHFPKKGGGIMAALQSDAEAANLLDLAVSVDLASTSSPSESCIHVLLNSSVAIPPEHYLHIDADTGDSLLHKIFRVNIYEVTTSQAIFRKLREALGETLKANEEADADTELSNFLETKNKEGKTVMDLCRAQLTSRRSASMAFLHVIKKWIVGLHKDLDDEFDAVVLEIESQVAEHQYTDMFQLDHHASAGANHLSDALLLLEKMDSEGNAAEFRSDFECPYELSRPLKP